jgi:hypothetical protein
MDRAPAPRRRGASIQHPKSSIENRVAGASEKDRRVCVAAGEHVGNSRINGATWVSDMHGNAAQVAESEAGAE